MNENTETIEKFLAYLLLKIFRITTLEELKQKKEEKIFEKKIIRMERNGFRDLYQEYYKETIGEENYQHLTFAALEAMMNHISINEVPFLKYRKTDGFRYYILRFNVLLKYYENQH